MDLFLNFLLWCVLSNPLFQIQIQCAEQWIYFSYFLLSLCCARYVISVSSVRFVNAPSSFFSMNCTYPPNSKSSKQRKENGPSFKRNKHTSTPLFFLHLSPPSLGCECCCHHCRRETLHLSISCI